MNTKFQAWFAQGKAVEALCGLDDYFTPDVTYRNDHDFGLAIGELLEWARLGHYEDAAAAFTTASRSLLDDQRFESALRLLKSYFVLQAYKHLSLPIDKQFLASCFGRAARENAQRLSHDEALRNLLLSLTSEMPELKAAIQ